MSRVGSKKAEGGVARYRMGLDGRTILAVDKKGNELVVSQLKEIPLYQAKIKTSRQVKALNAKLLEDRKKGYEDRRINLDG